jgi:hypothetical protein
VSIKILYDCCPALPNPLSATDVIFSLFNASFTSAFSSASVETLNLLQPPPDESKCLFLIVKLSVSDFDNASFP